MSGTLLVVAIAACVTDPREAEDTAHGDTFASDASASDAAANDANAADDSIGAEDSWVPSDGPIPPDTADAALDAVALVNVTPSAVSLGLGTALQLSATATYASGSTADVTALAIWVSSDASVASVIATGLTTGVHAGTAAVTAAYGGRAASAVVTVDLGAPTGLSILSPAPSVPLGSTLQLSAVAEYVDGSTRDVTSLALWTSTQAAKAGASPGQVVGAELGTGNIVAAFASRSASTTLTVTPAVVTSIAITPNQPILNLICSSTVQLVAMGTYSDTSRKDVTAQTTWSSVNPTTATVGANTGVVAPAPGVVGGVTSITASLDSITATSTVTVDGLTPAALVVTPSVASIGVSGTVQLRGEVVVVDGSSCDLTSQCAWQSSAPGVVTVSSGGLVSGVAAGSVTITGTFDGVVSDIAQVTVH
jgi:Big-like domain-containing protein